MERRVQVKMLFYGKQCLVQYYERCSSSWFEMTAEFNRLSYD